MRILVPVRHAMSMSFALALMSMMMACPTPKPVVPADASDGATLDGVQITTSSCHEAMVRLQQLNCPEGDVPDVGDNYEQACAHGQSTREFDLRPDCIVHAVDIPQLQRDCNIHCLRGAR